MKRSLKKTAGCGGGYRSKTLNTAKEQGVRSRE